MGSPLIDTHVHLWNPLKFEYPWLDELPALKRSFLPHHYDNATRSVEIEGFVFIQCEAVPSQAMDEAEWVSSLAREEPRLKGIVPFAPLEKGEGSREDLEKLAGDPLIKGIRRHFQFEPDPEFCLRPEIIKGIQLLPEYNFSFDILVSHGQLANTIRMVEQCPDVTFILDHIAKPNIKDRVFDPWKKEIRELAKMSNVYCKISGLVTEADHENWTREDLKPYIDHVIDCFGFDRVMYGGDWPVATLATVYPRWLDALEWAVRGCSEEESRKLFHDNAKRIYKLAD